MKLLLVAVALAALGCRLPCPPLPGPLADRCRAARGTFDQCYAKCRELGRPDQECFDRCRAGEP